MIEKTKNAIEDNRIIKQVINRIKPDAIIRIKLFSFIARKSSINDILNNNINKINTDIDNITTILHPV